MSLNEEQSLEIAGWKDCSCADGPGVRGVLFLQGCSRNCPGCQNSHINRFGEGMILTVTNLVSILKKKCMMRKITISGGEPLEQREGLLVLLQLLKKEGFEICLYTGFELQNMPNEILAQIDYIKVGQFIKSEGACLQYVGSSNQHFYALEKGYVVSEIDTRV